MPSLQRSIKHTLNKLVDEAVHKGRSGARTPEGILVDELLHAVVEGGFNPDKFFRYSVLPNLRKPARRSKLRRRKPRQDDTLLLLP